MDNFKETYISFCLNLIDNYESTYLARVKGNSMKGVGIGNGDWLIVDSSQPIYDECIAVFSLKGIDTIRKYKKKKNCVQLIAENPKYKTVTFPLDEPLNTSGVVVLVIKKLNDKEK